MKAALLIVFCLVSLSAFAQDKIITKDGEIIEAKVTEVGTRSIIYKHFDSPNGPEYSINKREVDKIKYQNGSEVEFDAVDRRPGPPERPHFATERKNIKYAPSILAIAPLQLTENGIGFGVTYERMLDKEGVIGLYLPLMLTFDVNNEDNVAYPSYSNSSGDPMFYFAPGLKFYPTTNKGIVKYSVGPSFVIASGTQTNYDYYNGTGTVTLQQNHFMFGVMVNNTLNINPSPHVYLGLELGLGGTYINRLDGANVGSTGLVQFAFRIGYRF